MPDRIDQASGRDRQRAGRAEIERPDQLGSQLLLYLLRIFPRPVSEREKSICVLGGAVGIFCPMLARDLFGFPEER
ncbi:hypothetical protein AQJ67_24740 [Streptomyces caeruleatus]|uniref:Uncharacterized protein n=1 Tax=Streptomyces caeruleatus TaxID=661399 RepID=A0A101TX51_9ACTN|nr:hypothetical protein AQJ67_24740 [Streptomyces caeruleatus]